MSGKKKPTKPTTHEDEIVQTPGDDCDLEIDCDLTGIDGAQLSGLSRGDRLILRLDQMGGYNAIVCITPTGGVVGSIVNIPNHVRLVGCLRRNVRYEVYVMELGPGRLRVVGGMVR